MDDPVQTLEALNRQLQQKVQELELADMRLDAALKGEALCLYIQNQDLVFVWAYKIAERFGGMSALGKTDHDLGLPSEQATRAAAMKREVLQSHKTVDWEGWVKDVNLEDRYVTMRYVPYQFPDGQWGLIGKVFDLTEHKRNEAKVLQQASQLKELASSLEKEKEALSDALKKLSVENQRTREDLAEARELQASLLPSGKIDMPGFDIATHTETSQEVGGDYYDFQSIAEGGMVLALGDATGHGLRAGILVAMVKSYFQLLAAHRSPTEMLERISDNLAGMRLRKMYMGLMVAKYDHNEFWLASAGMPPLLVYRKASGAVESIMQPNIFLGTHIPVKKNMIRFILEGGDMMVAMSDGLTEAMSPQGEMIPASLIEETVKMHAPGGTQATVDALVDLQTRWSRTTQLRDDTTIVAVMKQ